MALVCCAQGADGKPSIQLQLKPQAILLRKSRTKRFQTWNGNSAGSTPPHIQMMPT